MSGPCKGCGKTFTHKLWLVWGYCPSCSDELRAKPVDGDCYDDDRYEELRERELLDEGGEG